MFRSFLFIVLIFLISSASARSESFPEISIGYCLDSSTLILKGRMLDEDGSIKIEAVLKGAFPSNQVLIPEFQDINNFGDYSPEMKADWEVIIFLKTSEQYEIVPVFYWDSDAKMSKALGFGLSTLWFKDGNVFYGSSGPDDVIKFVRQGEQHAIETNIIEHVKTEDAINRIEKYKSCRKKFNQLEQLYKQSDYAEMIFDAMLKTECGDQILDFVRPTVLDSQYTYMQRKMLPSFVEYGKQQVVPDLESMFDKEFRFWKAYIGVPERKRWWQFDSALQMRFAIFGTLMRLIIENKLGDWERHTNEVIDYFGSLEAYRTNYGYGKLHESVQYWLDN
jgi:hypothetical protein